MNDRRQQLALFVRTVETGSFSKAACGLRLARPSVLRAANYQYLGVSNPHALSREICG
jgi:hypothetical protein